MYLIIDSNGTIAAMTGVLDYVATTASGVTVTVATDKATAVYDADGGRFYRLRPAWPGDEAHHVVEVEAVPEGVVPGRWKYADGAFTRDETVDELTMTQLAVAELAQTVEENNTANQLAIAELAEAWSAREQGTKTGEQPRAQGGAEGPGWVLAESDGLGPVAEGAQRDMAEAVLGGEA